MSVIRPNMDPGVALRIALVAPPVKAVPPVGYGGTERVVAALAAGLVDRGHDVTLFASGDSQTPARLVPIVPRALWEAGYRGDLGAYMQIAASLAWAKHERFDVIHSHLESYGFTLARHCPTPVVSTLHGRLDQGGMPEALAGFSEIPLVAISANQRRWFPDLNWMATVHHGLPLDDMPFQSEPGVYFALVGRLSEEKGISDAIRLAERCGVPLEIAAKAYAPDEKALLDSVVRPAVQTGRVTFLGELVAPERDELLSGALATLMLGSWPEPFGLVAIESLATGTPVIARRAGALPELIEPGVDGFLVDDLSEAELAVRQVATLDRTLIRQRALERFSTERMTLDYEAVYARVLRGGGQVRAPARMQGVTRAAAFEALPARVASGAAEPTGVLVESARGSGRAWSRERA